jgi:hypothetical protein
MSDPRLLACYCPPGANRAGFYFVAPLNMALSLLRLGLFVGEAVSRSIFRDFQNML